MKATKTTVSVPGVTLDLTAEEAAILGRIAERLRREPALAAAVLVANGDTKLADNLKFPVTTVRAASTLMTKVYFELAKAR